MRVSVLTVVTTVVLGVLSFAQEQPLGDVARQTRAQTSQHPRAAKVLTNEETDGHAITANDDPLDVVTKARDALLHDTSHRCRKESSGNSGPGWADLMVTEVAGTDRIRIIGDQMRPNHTHSEAILIGNDGYRRTENGPWEKLSTAEAMSFRPAAIILPNELKFGYKSGDLKLVGPQIVDGSPTFLYQFRSSQVERTISIWVGSNDNLPRKTEMFTHDLSMGTSWRETTSCTYGVNIKIEPPL